MGERRGRRDHSSGVRSAGKRREDASLRCVGTVARPLLRLHARISAWCEVHMELRRRGGDNRRLLRGPRPWSAG
jgi:hypothetical protein